MKLFLYFLLLPLSLMAAPLYLYDLLPQAEKGDYTVIVRNHCYTMLFVQEKREEALLFHEITIPEQNFCSASWKEWLQRGAPGHTGWVAYTVSLPTGRLENLYSFTLNSWIRTKGDEAIFSTLVNLSFQPISDRQRHHITNDQGQSVLWQPPLVVEGVQERGAQFNAFEAYWPEDRSELSGKLVQIYLPSERGPYPSYFPYWVKVKGGVARAMLRVVDSGKGATTYRQLP